MLFLMVLHCLPLGAAEAELAPILAANQALFRELEEFSFEFELRKDEPKGRLSSRYKYTSSRGQFLWTSLGDIQHQTYHYDRTSGTSRLFNRATGRQDGNGELLLNSKPNYGVPFVQLGLCHLSGRSRPPIVLLETYLQNAKGLKAKRRSDATSVSFTMPLGTDPASTRTAECTLLFDPHRSFLMAKREAASAEGARNSVTELLEATEIKPGFFFPTLVKVTGYRNGILESCSYGAVQNARFGPFTDEELAFSFPEGCRVADPVNQKQYRVTNGQLVGDDSVPDRLLKGQPLSASGPSVTAGLQTLEEPSSWLNFLLPRRRRGPDCSFVVFP